MGNLIVIIVLILIVGFSIRHVISDMKKGGCPGGGSCSCCGSSCPSREPGGIDEAKASEILKTIKKPDKLIR